MIYFTRPNRHSNQDPRKCNAWTLKGAKRIALKRGDVIVGKTKNGKTVNLFEYFIYKEEWITLM